MTTAETDGLIRERERGESVELVLDADAVEVEERDERPEVYDEHKKIVEEGADVLDEPKRRFNILHRMMRQLGPEFGPADRFSHDDKMLIADERNMTPRIPVGASFERMSARDRDRLRRSVEMAVEANGLAAMIGVNCLVVDPRFDTDNTLDVGWEVEQCNVPMETLRNEGVDPSDVAVVDRDGVQTLFIDTSDMTYYYRGTCDGNGVTDGWLVELDEAAKNTDDVLENHVKPDSVTAAEQAGLDVHRQGDWFFVEQHSDFMPTGISRRPDLQPDGECDFLQNHAAGWLGHDALNPDRVFVRGDVTHLNDDHEVLSLPEGQWFEAKHNGVESTSFECDPYQMDRMRTGLRSHSESHGNLF